MKITIFCTHLSKGRVTIIQDLYVQNTNSFKKKRIDTKINFEHSILNDPCSY